MPINSIFKVSHGKARQTRKEDFQTFHNHVCGPSSRKAFLKGICFITEVSNHRDFTFVWFYKEMILNTNLIEAQAKKREDVKWVPFFTIRPKNYSIFEVTLGLG